MTTKLGRRPEPEPGPARLTLLNHDPAGPGGDVVSSPTPPGPATDRPGPRWSAGTRGVTTASQQPGPRVLLVEDNAPLRASLRELLEDEGFSVVGEAGDGEEGVASAVELDPDLVVMDLKMPVMDGIEATRRIREATGARILVMTAYHDHALERWAMEAGAYAVVGKASPFDQLRTLLLDAVDSPGPGGPGPGTAA
jgi:CheY-like chemotaxis protein